MRHRILVGPALAAAGLFAWAGVAWCDPVQAPGTIITVAGSGLPIYGAGGPPDPDVLGDYGPATAATLTLPANVAVDRKGDLFIADPRHHRVRVVQGQGMIETAAGSGDTYTSERSDGDGEPGGSAKLDDPFGLAVEPDGSLLIVDRSAHRVRRLNTDGVISTFAGSDPATFDGGGFSGDGGPAIDAELNNPEGVAVGPDGSAYVADTGNGRIRKIDPSGIITTIAGGVGPHFGLNEGGLATSAHLRAVQSLAVDASGNVYYSDPVNQRVRMVAPNGIVTTVAGIGDTGFYGDGGPAIRASFRSPAGLAVDSAGDLFIADSGNNRIREVTPDGTISTVAGSGPANQPQGFIVGGFAGDGGPATQARLYHPGGVDVDANGNLFIADSVNNRVREVIGVAAAAQSGPKPLPGDLNGDGKVTVADVTLALRIATGLLRPTSTELAAGDLHGMGSVNVADAVLILRMAVGL